MEFFVFKVNAKIFNFTTKLDFRWKFQLVFKRKFTDMQFYWHLIFNIFGKKYFFLFKVSSFFMFPMINYGIYFCLFILRQPLTLIFLLSFRTCSYYSLTFINSHTLSLDTIYFSFEKLAKGVFVLNLSC